MSKIWFAATSFICCSMCNAAYSASIISLPNTGISVLGFAINVPVTISELGDGVSPSLGAFDLNVTFDPAVIAYRNTVFGDAILSDQLDLSGSGNNPAFAGLVRTGVLNLFDLSLDSATALNEYQAGSFTLATITFQALAVGSSPLGIFINSLGDALGNPLPTTVSNSSITIVAEPSTATLLAVGALGLFWLTRGKHRKPRLHAREQRR